MSEEKKVMTLQEQLRADLIEMYLAGDITAAETAQSMEVSLRQCRRLVSRYRESGRDGVVNLRRGKPGNYQLKEELKTQAVKLIRTRCRGMSPTGAWRLLNAGFGLSISKETVRKLMMAENTWVAHPGKIP